MMHALAAITGAQSSEDVADQPSQVHHRWKFTLHEDILQISGHQPINVSQALYETQLQVQQNSMSLERRMEELVAHTRSELESAAVEMERKLQVQLQQSFRASQAAAESTVAEAVQVITARADTAEAKLIEARARLDEAVDIHVANSQLIAPDNIAQACEEQLQEAMTIAQASFDAAVDVKAAQHVFVLESRIHERVEHTQQQALHAVSPQVNECETRMQKELEVLMADAREHTESGIATLKTKLDKRVVEFNYKLENAVRERVTADVNSMEKKLNRQLQTASTKMAAEAEKKAFSVVAEAEKRIVSVRIGADASMRNEMAKQVELAKAVEVKLSSQLEALKVSQGLYESHGKYGSVVLCAEL